MRIMTSEEGSAQDLTKFDGSDCSFWRMQVEDYLYSKKLHLALGDKLEGMKDDEWKLLDRQVLGVIHLTLSKNVAHNVTTENESPKCHNNYSQLS